MNLRQELRLHDTVKTQLVLTEKAGMMTSKRTFGAAGPESRTCVTKLQDAGVSVWGQLRPQGHCPASEGRSLSRGAQEGCYGLATQQGGPLS